MRYPTTKKLPTKCEAVAPSSSSSCAWPSARCRSHARSEEEGEDEEEGGGDGGTYGEMRICVTHAWRRRWGQEVIPPQAAPRRRRMQARAVAAKERFRDRADST